MRAGAHPAAEARHRNAAHLQLRLQGGDIHARAADIEEHQVGVRLLDLHARDLAQAAGELMVFVRADDPAMLHEAVQVCDDVRARLAQLAATPGADDTAPIVRVPATGAVVAVIDDGGTSATGAPRVIRDAPTPRERRQ